MIQLVGRNALGKFAPEFAYYSDGFLFGKNWNNADIGVKHGVSLRCFTHAQRICKTAYSR